VLFTKIGPDYVHYNLNDCLNISLVYSSVMRYGQSKYCN